MAKNISIAIIGLSLSTTNHIKKLLSLIVNDEYNLHWTNIADKNLTLLVINENFVDSPVIQKINIPHLKTLTINHDPKITNTIINNQLFMPFNNHELLRVWFENYVLANTSTPTNSSIKISPNQDLSSIDALHECLAQSKEQFYKCIINHDQYFLIDTKLHEVRVSSDFHINQIQHLEIKPLSFNEVVSLRTQKDKFDLSYWLWNFLWNHLDVIPQVRENYYQLTRWPQPIESNAKNCLKIASYFQHGAHSEYIQQHSEFDQNIIHKFIYVSRTVNILNETNETSAKFKLASTYEPQSQIKSFFSKIRKKLGI